MSKEPLSGASASPQRSVQYCRSALLGLYRPSEPPAAFAPLAEVLAAVLCDGRPPVLNAAEEFPRPLGEDPSFRPHLKDRRSEAVPEWFQGPSAHSTAASSRTSPPLSASPYGKETKPQAKEPRPVRVRLTDGSRNVPSDIQLTGTDVVRPPTKPADDTSPKPDSDSRPRLNPDAQPWSGSYTDSRLPLYHVAILKEKTQRGDPFAGILLESGVVDACGFMSQPGGSKATEKVWFYKDPQGLTQGPFTSVEMFNWNAAGYFSPELPVALRSKSHFLPLSCYIRRTPVKREKEERGDDVTASNELKAMLGVGEEQPSGCRG